MKLSAGFLIVTTVITLGGSFLLDTFSRAASSSGGLTQPSRPNLIRPDSTLSEPGPQFLLQKITALEKEVGTLREEVKLLQTHRHHHKKTALPGGCGWMSVSNFLFQAENNAKFKQDCGLILGSTTPSKNTPDNMESNFTSTPVY